ncbi:phage portal protein [Brevibacillus brevis]|uniref:phage portal protein n=1 Tax=Brevibacillus brevis TaxID=1393 RepID=UPI0036389A0F
MDIAYHGVKARSESRKAIGIRKVTNSGYSNSGASRRKNSMKGWNSDSKSPQEDIGQNLAVLRERSRDLYMGGGLATGAIKKNQSNVVGLRTHTQMPTQLPFTWYYGGAGKRVGRSYRV